MIIHTTLAATALALLLLPGASGQDAHFQEGHVPPRDAGAPVPTGSVATTADGGEDEGPPALHTRRVGAPPAIDGRLDDAVWQEAEVATSFTQMRPDPGAPASQRTEVRVLHDDDALYVAARLHDTAPDSIVAQLGRRDSGVYSDWFFVAIDSYFDRRTAFVFGLNPRAVMSDRLLHSDVQQDASWDAVWAGAARVDDEGWTAEFRIPLSQLRFSPTETGETQRWGLNFMRNIARHDEEAFWAETRPDDGRVVSAFGVLRGLDDLEPSRRLEVMPYAVASATAAPTDAGDPLHRDVDPFGGVGADVKAGVTSDLTLTATINPDFGQVEADPSEVNLTAFESYFSEKRPFFVEGVDIFDFKLAFGDGDLGNQSLFYSRRIGRAPQGDVDGDFTRAPDATTIVGAAKLSGKTASGWSIGVLDAVTAAEYGDFVEDGVEGETPIEPLTNYGVVRVMKDFRAGQSAVGAIFTTTHRSLPSSGELDWLRRSAYSGGLDFRHRFGGETYQVSGSLMASHVRGSAEALDEVQRSAVHYFQRPDADHLDYDPERTSMGGYAAKGVFTKVKGDWRFMLFGLAISPEFEVNDLGFQTDSDMGLSAAWIGYQQNDPGPLFRRWNLGMNAWAGTTFGGERVGLGGNLNGSFQLTTFWGGYGGLNVEAPTYSPSLLRGGPAFRVPAGGSGWFGLYTDRRRTVSFRLGLRGSWRDESSAAGLSISPSLSIRPSDNASLSVGPSFSRRRNALQFVDHARVAGSDRWVLGTVEQTTVAMTARLDYTFSPTLSLQLYAQPFISAGDYSGFSTVVDPRATSLAVGLRPLTGQALTSGIVDDQRVYTADLDGDGSLDHEFDDPGFSFRQLRSNAVLRWEYRPGSALFLVWSQGRTDFARDGRFRLGDDVSDLFGAEGTNVLMVKVSYWLGL